MRYVFPAAMAVLSMLAPSGLWGQDATVKLVPGDATVGQNLEASATVTLNGMTPGKDLPITLKSNDPGRLLLSATAEGPGSASIVITLPPPLHESGDFYLQGRGKSGTVTYTASAPGVSSGTGTVTLAPSGIVIFGPYDKASFLTTTGTAREISVHAALLDSSLKYVAKQLVAGGLSVKATVTGSNIAVGKMATSLVTIPGGSSSTTAQFQPATPGETSLGVNTPPGFSTPAEHASVTAKVVTPRLGLTEEETVGRNLQGGGVLGLGEPAPAGGVVVTLTSNDPSRLLLANDTTSGKGSGSIKIAMPPGSLNTLYSLQALSDSGTVTYTASAPGYTGRTATVTLAPAGVVVAGPISFPRSGGPRDPGFMTSLAAGPTTLHIYTVFLDPVTKRASDMTVQSVRSDLLPLRVALETSDPAIGTVPSPVTINGGWDSITTQFTPLKTGRVTISIVTPEGYATPANATRLTAIIMP